MQRRQLLPSAAAEGTRPRDISLEASPFYEASAACPTDKSSVENEALAKSTTMEGGKVDMHDTVGGRTRSVFMTVKILHSCIILKTLARAIKEQRSEARGKLSSAPF